MTLHSTILAKVAQQFILKLSESKGSVISTQRIDVALGQKDSLASLKRSGLIEIDPKGNGNRGYDGESDIFHQQKL